VMLFRNQLRGGSESSFDFNFRPVIARRSFIMPMTLLIFVRNYRGLSGLPLFSRRLLRRPVRTVVRREGFGKRFIYTIGPSTIVSNDLVGNFRHGCAPQISPGEVPDCRF
jgi:hypothetical protein